MTQRPELLGLELLTAWAIGLLAGGALADSGSSGKPKIGLAFVSLFLALMWIVFLAVCVADLFFDRGLFP